MKKCLSCGLGRQYDRRSVTGTGMPDETKGPTKLFLPKVRSGNWKNWVTVSLSRLTGEVSYVGIRRQNSQTSGEGADVFKKPIEYSPQGGFLGSRPWPPPVEEHSYAPSGPSWRGRGGSSGSRRSRGQGLGRGFWG